MPTKTIPVPIIDDTHEDDVETFTVTLSNPVNATIADGTATGTIHNTEDPREPSDTLTASFGGMPTEHDGTPFTFTLTFSEEPQVGYAVLRDDAFAVSGGMVKTAQRVAPGSNRSWTITVEPMGHVDVAITLPATTDCDATGAVCTADDRPLSNANAATVRALPALSVADAVTTEGAGATLDFAVTLSRAASGPVTVGYATADGTAVAGADYTAASDTLSFAAGETSKTVRVAVLDDAHDEGEETLTLTLSNAAGGRLTDGEATGTIKNADPLPRALLARFGRTAAVHVVEHIEERIAAPRAPGVEGRFAGRALRPGMAREIALNVLSQLGASVGGNPVGAGVHDPRAGAPTAGVAALGTPGRAGGGMGMATMTGPMDARAGSDRGLTGRGLLDMGLGGGDVLTGSAVAVNRETHGGILSFWSRGARSSFAGREGALSLGGDVRTTMVGADYAKGPLVAGLSLSHSRGLGKYVGVTGGQVASSVTGLYPWLGYQVTDRVSVWGVTGYGAGAQERAVDGDGGGRHAGRAGRGRGGRLRAGVQGRCPVGRYVDRRRGRPGGAPGGDRGGGDPLPDGAGGLAGLHARRPAVAQAERRGRAAARRRGRRERRRHGRGRRAGGVRPVDRAGRRPAGADAGDAPGRGVPRVGPGGLAQLQPDAIDAAGLCGAGGAVVGRPGDERGRGAVGPGDDGGAGARQPRVGQPPRWRGRLRAAGGQPLRGDAHARRRDLRRRAGLPARLPPRRARRRGHGVRAGRRRAAPGTPPAGRHGSRRARAGHGALVAAAPGPPYLAWAKRDDTTDIAEQVFEDLRRAPHVYLLPEYGDADSEREILDDFWPDLFVAMLNCWLTDEQQWPKNRTHQMFGEWFDLQMCPVVEDLHLDEELVELD